MAWGQIAQLKGPQGDQGPAGGQGLKGDQGDPGPAGADGKSVSINGTVANAAALPTDLTVVDAGKGYVTANDGHLHVWSGTEFTDVGQVKGDKGDQGVKGDQGDEGPQGEQGVQGVKGDTGNTGTAGARGATWFTGSAGPVDVPGSQPGDLFLDTSSGNVYVLS